jgi:hypothetical protein
VGVIQQPINGSLDIEPRAAFREPSPRIFGGETVVDELSNSLIKWIIRCGWRFSLGVRRGVFDRLSWFRLPRKRRGRLLPNLIHWFTKVAEQVVILVYILGSLWRRLVGSRLELAESKRIVIVVAARTSATRCRRLAPSLRIAEI